MNIIWIILAACCFIGGQVFVLYCLRALDKRLNRRAEDKLRHVLKEKHRNPDEDVVE